MDFFSLFLPSSETTVVIDAILRLVLEGVAVGSGIVLFDFVDGVTDGVWLDWTGVVPGSVFIFFRTGSESGIEAVACFEPRAEMPIPKKSCKAEY